MQQRIPRVALTTLSIHLFVRARVHSNIWTPQHPEHDLQAFRRASIADLGVVRFDQRQQTRPRHHLVHLGQKLCASRDLLMLLRTRSPCQMSFASSLHFLYEVCFPRNAATSLCVDLIRPSSGLLLDFFKALLAFSCHS